jgi:hypothetical protein
MVFQWNKIALALFLVASVAMAQPPVKERPQRLAGPDARGIMGRGRAVRVEDITPGTRLRAQLENLPPQARATALRKLESFSFHKNDIASLRADNLGGIYYACSFVSVGDDQEQAGSICGAGCSHTFAAAGTMAAVPEELLFDEKGEPWGAGAPVAVTNPPVYHSRPGSENVLFLDFRGFVVTGTRWNTEAGVAEWVARPYDIDGDETTFSDQEQLNIYQIWKRVAEDYAPFDINVTTEKPAQWNRRTAHALITPTVDANGVNMPHFNTGGYAYVNVFGLVSFSYDSAHPYSPAFVTSRGSSHVSPANIADAASHEIGHNLGLSHDGTSSLEYYGGHGATAEAPSWGPIMGTGYGRNLSQWSQGEYHNANQFQDDLLIIAGKLGYIPVDHGDSFATATVLQPDGVLQITTNGVIERTGDVDMFRFETGAGAITFNLTTTRIGTGTWGGNLDAALLLYDNNGILLASNNPPAEVNASISISVAAGMYFLAVTPVGAGSPMNATPSGYTVYGSLGPYVLTGSVQASGDDVFLISPNGGEVFYRGQTNMIIWSSGVSDTVDLTLFKGGLLHSVIALAVPNNGSYGWVIPAGHPRGSDFRVRVSQTGDATNFASSNTDFSIFDAPVVAVLLHEDFEGSASLPSGWSQQVLEGSGTWTIQNGGGSSGGQNPDAAYSGVRNVTLFRQSTTNNRVRLRTPAFDAASFTNVVLRFQHHMQEWSPDQDFLNVFYSANGGTDWNWLAGYSNNVPAWTLRELQLPATSANMVVGFEGNAKYGYGICLDDVSVTAYVEPAALEEIRISTNALQITEGQTGTFSVFLSASPAHNVTVLVSRVDGATNIVVESGASLIFTPENGTNSLPVTIRAGTDSNWTNDAAVFVCMDPAGGYISSPFITVTEVDVDVDPASLLPFSENFDDAGMASVPGALHGQHGWQSDVGAVVEAAAGRGASQALLLTGQAEKAFTNGTNQVYVSAWIRPVGGELGDVEGSPTAIFWVDTNRYVRAFSNATEVVFPVQVDFAAYNHFEVWVDYAAGTWRLDVNGTVAGSSLGVYSARAAFTGIMLQNRASEPAFFDDISISSSSPPPLDTFQQWLVDNGYSADVGGDALAANGVQSLREMFVAGLDPNDPGSRFAITSAEVSGGSFLLDWAGVSGRVYNVYWTTNLLDGFSLWRSNVQWSATSVADESLGSGSARYYRIEVQLEE